MTSATSNSARSTPDLNKVERAGREFLCKLCQQKITETQSITSTAFLGYQGPAILVRQVSNVKPGPPIAQLMRSGGFMVQELECQDCATVLGWKVIKAFERSEKWKENGFLLELNLLVEVDVDLEDVFKRYYRSSTTPPKQDDRSTTPSDTDSDQGPKTPIPRFAKLEVDTTYRKNETSGQPPSPEPISAAVSFFDASTSDNEEEGTTPTTSDVEEGTAPEVDVPASPTIHRRVASLEPTSTGPKTVLPRRPSEPLVYVQPSKTMAPSSSPPLKPTSILRNTKPPPMHNLPSVPVIITPPNPHDSLASEIDRMARDLQPILEALPHTPSTPPKTTEQLSTELPAISALGTVSKEPIVVAPTASTLRLRRPSIGSTANRPSFAEQTTGIPPLPAGAAMHVRKLSNTPPTLSPKGSVSSSPSTASSPLPSSSSKASLEGPLLTPASSVPDAVLHVTKRVSPPGVRFEAKSVVIDEEASARQERARVAELTRVLALDGSIPPLTPRFPTSTTAPSFPPIEPVAVPAVPVASGSLNVPGKTLPFPRAPTPDAALLANRTVRKRALSQPGRRPSLADLRAARNESDTAMPAVAPVVVPQNVVQTSAPSSRTNSIVNADGQPVVTTRLPAMTKRPSLKNLNAAASSSSSLPIPRKGSVTPESRPSSRATSVIDSDERPLVVTTRLPAMATRRVLQNGDASRPSSRALSFFETDPKESNVVTRLPALKRRPSVPDLPSIRDNPPPTAIKSSFSLFKKKIQL